MTSVRAIAIELRERGHYLDELYQITIAYATSLYTRYCTVDARCDAIELSYQTEEEWDRLDDERSDIENELDELFNTVIGFDYEHDPFKK